jgi:hypothetical protein
MDDHKISSRNGGLYFSDGLLDIFTGLGLLSAGGLMLVDLVFLIGVYPATMMPAWQAARKKSLERLTAKAGGQMAEAYQTRIRAVILGALIAGMLFLGLGLVAFFGFDRVPASIFDWMRMNFAILTGLLAAIFFSVTGLVLGIRRFYLYAIGALALFALGHMLGVTLPFLVLALGVFVTLAGLFVYLRFLGEHPR